MRCLPPRVRLEEGIRSEMSTISSPRRRKSHPYTIMPSEGGTEEALDDYFRRCRKHPVVGHARPGEGLLAAAPTEEARQSSEGRPQDKRQEVLWRRGRKGDRRKGQRVLDLDAHRLHRDSLLR